MITKLLYFVKRPASKDVIINTVGNYLNVFFTAFFALLLVRILSPSEYGVLSVLFGIAYVLANILDFGTTATIYSYLPPMIEKKSLDMYRLIKSTFYYQSVFSLIVIAILLVSFPFLDRVFFKTGAPLLILYITTFSVLFLLWQNFALNTLFAAKRFFRANLYLSIANIMKTVIIFVLMPLHLVSVGTIIFAFGILGPCIFFVFLFFEKKFVFMSVLNADIKKEEFRFGYTFTYFISSQFLNLGQRMDLFLMSYFRSKAEVGFYGLSQKIILTIITTIISITQVLSPMFSKIKTKREVFSQFKSAFTYMLLPTGLFFALFLIPNEVYFLFFTEKFAQTALITKQLTLPFILYPFMNILMLFLLYTVKKPVYVLVSSVTFFIGITTGCYILIPLYGVKGPPIAIFISFATSSIILLLSSLYEYKKMKEF